MVDELACELMESGGGEWWSSAGRRGGGGIRDLGGAGWVALAVNALGGQSCSMGVCAKVVCGGKTRLAWIDRAFAFS